MFLKKVNPWVFNSIFASCCTLRLIGIETHLSVCNSSRVQVVLFQNLNKLCQLQTATKQQTDDHTSLPVTTDLCYDCTTNKRKSTEIQKKKSHIFNQLPRVHHPCLGPLFIFFSPILSPSHTASPACHQRFPAFTCTFHVCRRFAQSSLGKTHEVRQVFYLFMR